MSNLISRSALLTVPNVRKVTEYDETGCGMDYLAVPVDAINAAPAVDAVPVVHARWQPIAGNHTNGVMLGCTAYQCSVCGRIEEENSEPFCHCCAKMDGGDDGAT